MHYSKPSAERRIKQLAELSSRVANGRAQTSKVKSSDELSRIEGAFTLLFDDLYMLRRRQVAQHAVTRVLDKAASLNDAMPKILRSLCTSLEWEWAALWTIDSNNNVLHCAGIWQGHKKHDAFTRLNRDFTFEKGVGLPGRVWASKQPAWIIDVQTDPNFPRWPVAKKSNLHSALCFPIQSAFGLLGVMEFLTVKHEEPDHALLEMMNAIGSQIGQFAARKAAEELSKAKMAEIASLQQMLEREFDLKLQENSLVRRSQVKLSLPAVTARESEIIKMLIKGLASKEIAAKLKLSLFTVNAHRQNILKKTKCRNTAELVSYALEYGLDKK